MPTTYRYVKTDGSVGTTTDQSNAPGIAPTSGFQAITSASLSPTSPISLPTAPTTPNYSGLVTNGAAVIAANGAAAAPTTQTDPYASLKDLIGSLPTPPSSSDLYAKDYADAGIDEKTAAYNTSKANFDAINARLQGLQAENTAANVAQEGRLAPMSQITGQQAANDRAYALKAIPLQIQALAAQADLTNNQNILQSAQQHLDTLFSIHSQDAQAQYQYKTNLINAVYDFADKQQQRLLDQQKLDQQQAFETKQNAIQYAQQVSAAAINNGQAGIAAKIGALDPNSPTYAQDVAAFAGQIAPKASSTSDWTLFNQADGTTVEYNQRTGEIRPIGSGGAAATQSKQLETVNSINNILSSSAFDNTFGFVNTIRRNIPGTDSYKLAADVNNLVSQLALAARGQLKGQGAVSDFEGKLLRDAQTALTINMNPTQARDELAQARGAIMTSSGLSANVIITAPNGMSKTGIANQQMIEDAISQGYTVRYAQ